MKIHQALCLAATLAIAAPASAADLLDRYEAAAETIGRKMFDFYVAKFPELEGTRPEIAWNEDFRAAGQCMLDEYTAKQGEAYAANMVDRAEKAAAMDIDSGEDLKTMIALQMPENMSMTEVMAVDQKCGMSQLGQERAKQSGFMDKFSELDLSSIMGP